MNTKRYLIICRRPPYGESYAREALDTALATAAFDQPVALLFLGDGVAQLLNAHDSATLGEKSFEKQLSALPMYDINTIYVDADALQRRGLTTADLSLPAQTVSDVDIVDLLKQHDIVLSF
ncbi:MAG: sulfurtransferase complex subunit TusC [Spongiibacteraceae bacterium]